MALPIGDFKLLAPNTGFASAGNKILWTTDNGEHWKDISPPGSNRGQIANVLFYDEETGWVLYLGDADDDDFVVCSTSDGGKTWTTAKIKIALQDPRSGGPELGGHGNIAFTDKLHGWLLFNFQTGSAFSSAGLYVTSDGGLTWHESNDNPGFYGTIRGFPNGDVWVSGGPGGDDHLAVSRRGGDGFDDVSFTAPKDIPTGDRPRFGMPEFEDNLHGFEAVTYTNTAETVPSSALVLYETLDGGHTWKPDRQLLSLAGRESAKSTVVGSTWIFAFAPKGSQPTLMKLPPGSRTGASAHGEGDLDKCSLTFLTLTNGWMNCKGELSSTIDGAANWKGITPRARDGILTQDVVTPAKSRPVSWKTVGHQAALPVSTRAKTAQAAGGTQSGIDQHLGFDSSTLPTKVQMQEWWSDSPYYDVGIYVPGSPSGPNNPRLTPGWVADITGQGWGIIPIWSGLQAPCACSSPTKTNPSKTYPTCNHFKSTFSNTPGQANVDGTKQADAAFASVTSLGLDGSIVYVDVENYDSNYIFPGTSTSCGAVVQNYLSGWVQEMHNLGGPGSAGVYGSIYNASADFSAAGTDEVYVSRYDSDVTVWHLNHNAKLGKKDLAGALGDDLWANEQRIHQYRIDVNETWGNTTLHIDSDIVDAMIVPSSGFKNVAATSYTVVTSGLNAISNEVFVNGSLQNGPAISSYEGVVFANGTTMPLPYTSGGIDYTVVASAINNPGQAVGYYYCLGKQQGCDGDIAYSDGGILFSPSTTAVPPPGYASTLVDFPGNTTIYLNAINDAGWIVGTYWNEYNYNEAPHCALWKPPYASTAPISFDLPGYDPSSNVENCTGINGLGQIVGAVGVEITDANGNPDTSYTAYRGEVQNGVPSNFSPLFASSDLNLNPSAINNNGLIAGTEGGNFGYGGNDTNGFLLNGPNLIAVSIPGTYATAVWSLNDDVQMPGDACDTTWNNCAYFLLDIPH